MTEKQGGSVEESLSGELSNIRSSVIKEVQELH